MHEDVRVDNYVVSHEVSHVCISVWCRGMSGVKEVITYEPTGETQTVNYSTSDKQEFEDKYISLLDTYNRKQIVPISVEEYALDMIFNSDTEQ